MGLITRSAPLLAAALLLLLLLLGAAPPAAAAAEWGALEEGMQGVIRLEDGTVIQLQEFRGWEGGGSARCAGMARGSSRQQAISCAPHLIGRQGVGHPSAGIRVPHPPPVHRHLCAAWGDHFELGSVPD